MDQNFQTSFIPKKPITEEKPVHARAVGVSTVVGIVVFFASLVSAGGVYAYKVVLEKQKTEKSASLDIAKGAFEPELISKLQSTDKRLTAANDILSKHISVTPVFDSLQALTLKGIRFNKFNYTVDSQNSSKIGVKISGIALNYETIAIQADVFGTKNKYIQDIVFSNLNLDEKSLVSFDLSFGLDKNFLLYEERQNRDLIKPTI